MRLLAAPLLFVIALTAHAADPPEYELKTGGAVEVVTGAKGSASLTIVPAAGRRVDTGAPVTLRLAVTPANGLELARKRFALADAADPRADAPRFDLPFTAAQAGSYQIVVDVRFWICAAKTCRPVREQATIDVTVTAPAAPTPNP